MEKLTNETLRGNWATLLLATGCDGALDYVRLSDEIDALIAAGSNGIYSNGTAGEFYAQSPQEFVEVSELLAEKCEKAGMPYQIGVSHMSAQLSLERLGTVRHLCPGAVQVILPDWFPVTLPEAIEFCRGMAQHSGGIPLVLYNPPHAKVKLEPVEWMAIKREVPSLIGVKVFDRNRDRTWYSEVAERVEGIAVFIPGHHLATGISLGAHGAYSNVACLNPAAAQRWYELMHTDMEAALELEQRINRFMGELIHPFISEGRYPNHSCDRFMALVGGWADVGASLRWPYRSIPAYQVARVRKAGHDIIPEFINH